jgi:hypothetical protein
MLEASTSIGQARARSVLSDAPAYCVLRTANFELRTANVQASVFGLRSSSAHYGLSIYLSRLLVASDKSTSARLRGLKA